MKIKYRNEIHEIGLDDGQNPRLMNNGQALNFNYRKLTDNSSVIFINGHKSNAFHAIDGNNIYVNIDGEAYNFEIIHDEEPDFSDSTSSGGSRLVVKPPMPGSIVKVLVNEGQKVAEGDGLVIVEAMKMETTLYSSIDGTITEVGVTAGEQVDADKVLLTVEKAE